MNKNIIMLGAIFGSLIGSYLPSLFGAGMLSMTSIIGGFVGGILGIWVTYRMLQ
jgi:hypothetical protein